MERDVQNTEVTNTEFQKQDWYEPELFVLDFRETKGGSDEEQQEDIDYAEGYS